MSRGLRDAVDRLTRDHKTSVVTDYGTRYVTVASLLQQLRECWMDTGSSGLSGAGQPQPPLHVPATDALGKIDKEVTERLAECTLRPRRGSTEEKVRAYGAAILKFGAGEVDEAERWVRSWVTVAEKVLNPPVNRRPLNKPCPSCGNQWVITPDGRQPAITINVQGPHTGWDANCAVCHAEWTAEQIPNLIRAAEAA